EVNDQRIAAKKFVIATGSRPLYPAIKGLHDVGYITNEEVFKQEHLWDRLVILGGKPSAIEFAQAFARLGSKVSIIVRGDSILPQEEPELVAKLYAVLLNSGIEIYLNSKVQAAYMQRKHKVLECVHDGGETYTVAADEILVALGRKPNVEGLGLENAGITYAQDGILVDRKLRSCKKHIYALGDVIRSPYKLTHIAEYQASIVLSNMLFRYPAKVKYQGFPYAIFTDPEYAHVGLTEQQARVANYKNIEVYKFDYKNLDSAIINNTPVGLIKVITSKGKILGASILGAHASNLIAEWGLAINMRANLADVAATIHAYPTFAQINRRVASKHVSRNFFSEHNRALVSFMQRLFAWA
ncbi:MAG TPA: FAD-dependent oxidoreductase, partial [Gammaproteobacteria bacterium]|nr:FAD-dependent oxidoreductase [Gammaproteobacteria bacterium]